MLKFAETQAKELISQLTEKCNRRWRETVDKTRFMGELKEGKLKKETIQLFYKNWGSFVPVINSIYTSAFYKHLWFFVKNVDLMEVYTQKVLDEFGHPSPPGSYSDSHRYGQCLGVDGGGNAAFTHAARGARPPRLSPDFDGRWTDSGILVLGSVGRRLRQLLP